MKPIAIDLGRAFWVIARMDEKGQPTVATLGSGGLIPALISEYQGGLVLGQLVDTPSAPPPLRDFYRLLSDSPATLKRLAERGRMTPSGELEVWLGGQWWSPKTLIAQLLHASTQVIKEYLNLNTALPTIASIPPDLDAQVLFGMRAAMEEAGLELVSWCPSPVALVFSEPDLRKKKNAMVLTAFVERGALTLGIVEIVDGFPMLQLSRKLEWGWEEPLPIDLVPGILQDLLLLAEEKIAVDAQDIERLLVAGEETWVPHLVSRLMESVKATYIPFSRPPFAVAMGTAMLAEEFDQMPMLWAPIASPTSVSQVNMRGLATPESTLQARGGARESSTTIDIHGAFELPLYLHAEQVNRLELKLTTRDGRGFSRKLELLHRSWNQESEGKNDPESTTRLSHQEGLLIAPLGVQLGDGEDFFALIPAYSAVPAKGKYRLPFPKSRGALWIVEGAMPHEPRPGLFGVIPIAPWTSYAGPEAFIEVELICNQEPLVEVVARVEGHPNTELAKVFSRKECKRLEPVQVAVMKDANISQEDEFNEALLDEAFGEEGTFLSKDAKDPKTSRGSGRTSVEESTQPDMEVPAELLDAGEQIGLKAARPGTPPPSPSAAGGLRAQRPPSHSSAPPSQSSLPGTERGGASWSRQTIQGNRGLELELEEERESFGEGDGATRVISMQDIGLLQGPGHLRLEGSASSIATIAQVEAVSFEQLEQVQENSFEIDDDDILEELPQDVRSMENLDAAYEDLSDLLEEEATIAPNMHVKPPRIEPATREPEPRPASVPPPSAPPRRTRSSGPMAAISSEELQVAVSTRSLDATESSEPEPKARESRASGMTSRSSSLSSRSTSSAPPTESSTTKEPARTRREEDDDSRDSDTERRKRSLEEMAQAMKKARSRHSSSRLGVNEKADAYPEDNANPADSHELSTEESQEELASSGASRIRSIAEKARQRLEQRENERTDGDISTPVSTGGSGTSLENALHKMEQARRLAAEARQIVDDVREMSGGLDDLLDQHSSLTEEDEDDGNMEGSVRREIRKILDMAHRIAEVEQNRLPSSTRKTLQRLAKDLEQQLQDQDGRTIMRLALQLANRIFDIMRRDLRPW